MTPHKLPKQQVQLEIWQKILFLNKTSELSSVLRKSAQHKVMFFHGYNEHYPINHKSNIQSYDQVLTKLGKACQDAQNPESL